MIILCGGGGIVGDKLIHSSTFAMSGRRVPGNHKGGYWKGIDT